MNRGRGARRARSRPGRIPPNVRNRINGVSFIPPADPPAFSDKPWNTATAQIGFSGDKVISPSTMHSAILSQLGLLSTQTLEYRFISCKVWALTPQRPLRVSFFGASSGPVALALLQDYGAPMKLPRVGYVWPASQQMLTYKSTSTDSIISVDVGKDAEGKDIPWLSYVNILWRSDVYNPITTRYELVQQCEESLLMLSLE